MKAPWLSVIIPTYNGADYLAHTLASIEAQADDRVEVVAVDDGSTDATLAILRSYSHRLALRIFTRNHVGNWVANTNFGLRKSHGRFACFLHQDDQWLPGRLRVLGGMLAQEPRATLLLHPANYVDARGRMVGVWRSPLAAGRCLDSGKLVEQLLVQNFIAVPSPLFAREAALRVGGLDESLWYTADWEFWLKLGATEPTLYHPHPLAAFRIHPKSQTAQGIARATEMRRQIEVVLMRHLPRWEAEHPGRPDVGRVARLSLEVNHALAACAHGQRPKLWPLASAFLALGPAGWSRFFRDSRLVERVAARLRAGLPANAVLRCWREACRNRQERFVQPTATYDASRFGSAPRLATPVADLPLTSRG